MNFIHITGRGVTPGVLPHPGVRPGGSTPGGIKSRPRGGGIRGRIQEGPSINDSNRQLIIYLFFILLELLVKLIK